LLFVVLLFVPLPVTPDLFYVSRVTELSRGIQPWRHHGFCCWEDHRVTTADS
jgi:hypothetical protein